MCFFDPIIEKHSPEVVCMSRPPAPPAGIIDIDLALQGGGSHGAFTWGVLDRLLDEPHLRIAAISGTSAGAVNAVALAAGLAADGRVGAQAKLREVWEAVADAGGIPGVFGSLTQHSQQLMSSWTEPLKAWSGLVQSWWGPWWGQALSPYQFNPLNVNPLRDVLTRHIDFEAVRQCGGMRLFISATHVRSGRLRIFRQDALSADVILASACLPLMFQAVDIEGESYWDGGFAGNPSLLPLIAESPAEDLMLIQINPQMHKSVPTSAKDIVERMNELSFNASLLKELRTLGLMQQLIAAEGRPTSRYKQALIRRVGQLRLHRIDGEGLLNELGSASKMDTRRSFLTRLHDQGYLAADRWLHAHAGDLGHRSTMNLDTELAE